MHGFVTDVGATPVAIDPEAHDRLVALTSHVPHVLANVVANQTGATRVEGHEPLAHAGGSLRDMTRIAGANPRIWVDIFLDNAERDPRRARRAPAPRSSRSRARSRQGDAGFLARWIGEATGNRRRMLEREYPDPGELQRIRVHVPDRPGVLAGITQALGAERINIEDFELHHVSPERGGTLTLLVAGEGEAQRAADLLERQGYSVVVSAVLEHEGRAGASRSRGISPSRATSRSRTARCCSAPSRTGRRRSAASAARATPPRRSRRCARSASRSTTTATKLTVHGAGLRGLRAADDRLRQRRDARAADRRAARLPGRRVHATGDESLSARPMERIAEPLAADGRADRDDRRARCR